MALIDDLRRLVFPIRVPAQRKASRQFLAFARKQELSSSPPLLEQLAELLDSPDWEVTNDAVKVVGHLRSEELTPQLAILARDPGQVGFVRRNALDALASFAAPTDAVLAAFQSGLDDPYWEVRMVATAGLAKHVDRQTGLEVEFRTRITPKRNWWGGLSYPESAFDVRIAIMQGLGSFACELDTLEVLLSATEDPLWKVRAAALEATVAVATRGGHRIPKVDSAIANFDQTCLDLRPRFPLSVSYNQAVAQWKKGESIAQQVTLSP